MRYLTQHILLGNAAFVFMIVALLTSWWQRAPQISRICQGIAMLSITASFLLGSVATIQMNHSMTTLHLVYAVLALLANAYIYWLLNHVERAAVQTQRIAIGIMIVLLYRLLVTGSTQ
jgi:hypothetical protein